jgi:hypothetical protein
MMRAHTGRSPIGPKTNDDPTEAKSSNWRILSPSTSNVRCPAPVLSTITAKRNCSPNPHATVRPRIAFRFVESA